MIWSAQQKARSLLHISGQNVFGIHVTFDPQGTRIATSGDGGTFVWDVKSGNQLTELVGGRSYARIAWSPTNDDIAGLSPLELRNAVTGDLRISLKPAENKKGPNRMLGNAFSANGKLVAAADAYELVGIWDATTGNCIHAFKMPLWASCVAFSPDSKLLAAGSGHGTNLPRGVIKVWNIATGQEAFSVGDEIEEGVWGLAFSPSGQLLAASTGHHHSRPGTNTGEIWVWNVQSQTVLYTLRGHECAVWHLAFSPDGKRLASASGPAPSLGNGPGQVKIWDLTTGECLWTLYEPRPIYGVAFSPDGRKIAYHPGN
jgi:WD40 repeat protein